MGGARSVDVGEMGDTGEMGMGINRIAKWFSYRGKSVMSLAFMAQRITGVILVIYLCTHLLFLSSLNSREVYESLTAVTLSKRFLIFDILLVLVGVFHGVNGVRIIIHEFGFAYDYRKALIFLTIFIAVFVWIYASLVMISLAK